MRKLVILLFIVFLTSLPVFSETTGTTYRLNTNRVDQLDVCKEILSNSALHKLYYENEYNSRSPYSPLVDEGLETEDVIPFSYSITVPRANLITGEPIEITCTLSNVTDRTQIVQTWDGPLYGPTDAGDGQFDFSIHYIEGTNATRLRYEGIFSHGKATWMIVQPHDKWEETYLLNPTNYQPYNLKRPGEYEFRSVYLSVNETAHEKRFESFAGLVPSSPVRIRVYPSGTNTVLMNGDASLPNQDLEPTRTTPVESGND